MSATKKSSLTKPRLKILERAFVAEYENRLPVQLGRSKEIAWLEENGYLKPMTRVFPGHFAVTVKGHELTNLGRMTYCASC